MSEDDVMTDYTEFKSSWPVSLLKELSKVSGVSEVIFKPDGLKVTLFVEQGFEFEFPHELNDENVQLVSRQFDDLRFEADWYVEKQHEEERKHSLKAAALSKLTDEERKVLGV